MSNARLLISGIGKRTQLLRLVARECSDRGIELLGGDASHLAPARGAVERFLELPMADDREFGQKFAAAVSECGITAHMTLIDPEITALARLQGEGAITNSQFLQPDLSTAEICEDKFKFYESMRTAGVPTVPTSLEPLAETPFIRKDRRGSASSGFQVFTVQSVAACSVYDGPNEYVYQPFVQSQHYCVDAYFSLITGLLVDCCAKAVLNKKAGESYLLRSVPPEPFIQILRQVAQSIPLRGIVNLDIYGADLQLMEVNCRIGGNYPASHVFGVDLLRHLFAELCDGVILTETFTEYATGTYVSKYLSFTEPYETS